MPLNIPLFNALVKTFGDVGVANEGQNADISTPPATAVTSRIKVSRYAKLESSGEQYTCKCPFCADVVGHLYVSYLWGSEILCGRQLYKFSRKLAICHRRNCLADPMNMSKFQRMLLDNYDEQDQEPIAVTEREEQAERRKIVLPHGIPLNDPTLPAYAREYVEGRGFDVNELADDYKIQVSLIDFYPDPCLVIPIYQRGELASWQARYIGEDFKESCGLPKYYNPPGTKKSWLVYNMDRAKMYDTVVLTEGVFDSLKVG